MEGVILRLIKVGAALKYLGRAMALVAYAMTEKTVIRQEDYSTSLASEYFKFASHRCRLYVISMPESVESTKIEV